MTSYHSKSNPDLEQPSSSFTQNQIYTTAYPVPSDHDNQPVPDNVIECYQLSKTVMLFALIDIFFGFFYAFFSFYYLIPLIVAIYGYYSAKRYNSGGVYFYSIYQIFVNIIRLSFSIYAYVLIRQDNTITDYTNYNLYIVLSVFTTMLGLYIARFSYKLYKSINQLSALEKDRLVMLNYPIRVIYW